MTIITTNKLISIMKKNNIPYDNDSRGSSRGGFYCQKDFNGNVSLSYYRRDGFYEQVNQIIKMGNILLNLGYPVFFDTDIRLWSVKIYFDNTDDKYVEYSEKALRESVKSLIEKELKSIKEQDEIKKEKDKVKKENKERKLNIAKTLNPGLKFDVLEKLSEDKIIGYVKLYGENEVVIHVQFGAELKDSFFGNEKDGKLWSLSLQPMSFERGYISGGSTSVSGCKTIEEGLIEYLVTWHIH